MPKMRINTGKCTKSMKAMDGKQRGNVTTHKEGTRSLKTSQISSKIKKN